MKLHIFRTASINIGKDKVTLCYKAYGDPLVIGGCGEVRLGDWTALHIKKAYFPSLENEEVRDLFGPLWLPREAHVTGVGDIHIPKNKDLIKEVHFNVIEWVKSGLEKCKAAEQERSLETWLWPEKEISIQA